MHHRESEELDEQQWENLMMYGFALPAALPHPAKGKGKSRAAEAEAAEAAEAAAAGGCSGNIKFEEKTIPPAVVRIIAEYLAANTR